VTATHSTEHDVFQCRDFMTDVNWEQVRLTALFEEDPDTNELST
jgi:hypothetical protein